VKTGPSPNSKLVEPEELKIDVETVSDKEIQKRVALGLPTGFPTLAEFMKTADGPAYVALTSRILAVSGLSVKQQAISHKLIHIDVTESDSLIRDIAKGYFFEVMHMIKSSPPTNRAVNEALKNDLTIRMILLSKNAAEKEDYELVAKERNTLKASLRSMNDAERDITRQLLDLGLAEFIITNKDRERFVRELNYKEILDDEIVPVDVNKPEEGYNDERDYVENGDQPIAQDGTILEVDYGDYGDRGVRDYNDYTPQVEFDNDDL
jgi:hypothetical protein